MVSETGAFAGSQSQYLQNIASDLANMPAIKALAYFDAPAHSGAFPYAAECGRNSSVCHPVTELPVPAGSGFQHGDRRRVPGSLASGGERTPDRQR